jgi:4-hydroxy-4-methyl-2-oxoglutarate aldolase
VQVHPGDVILADDDGVVVVKQQDIPSVLAAAEQRRQKEETIKQKIAAGELSVDFYGLRPVLEAEGVVYYDDESRLPPQPKR